MSDSKYTEYTDLFEDELQNLTVLLPLSPETITLNFTDSNDKNQATIIEESIKALDPGNNIPGLVKKFEDKPLKLASTDELSSLKTYIRKMLTKIHSDKLTKFSSSLNDIYHSRQTSVIQILNDISAIMDIPEFERNLYNLTEMVREYTEVAKKSLTNQKLPKMRLDLETQLDKTLNSVLNTDNVLNTAQLLRLIDIRSTFASQHTMIINFLLKNPNKFSWTTDQFILLIEKVKNTKLKTAILEQFKDNLSQFTWDAKQLNSLVKCFNISPPRDIDKDQQDIVLGLLIGNLGTILLDDSHWQLIKDAMIDPNRAKFWQNKWQESSASIESITNALSNVVNHRVTLIALFRDLQDTGNTPEKLSDFYQKFLHLKELEDILSHQVSARLNGVGAELENLDIQTQLKLVLPIIHREDLNLLLSQYTSNLSSWGTLTHSPNKEMLYHLMQQEDSLIDTTETVTSPSVHPSEATIESVTKTAEPILTSADLKENISFNLAQYVRVLKTISLLWSIEIESITRVNELLLKRSSTKNYSLEPFTTKNELLSEMFAFLDRFDILESEIKNATSLTKEQRSEVDKEYKLLRRLFSHSLNIIPTESIFKKIKDLDVLFKAESSINIKFKYLSEMELLQAKLNGTELDENFVILKENDGKVVNKEALHKIIEDNRTAAKDILSQALHSLSTLVNVDADTFISTPGRVEKELIHQTAFETGTCDLLGKRPEQEDTLVVSRLKSSDLINLTAHDIGHRLWTALKKIDEDVIADSSLERQGATASTTIIRGDDVITATIGDSVSFAILYDEVGNPVVFRLNHRLHAPDEPQESERLKTLGSDLQPVIVDTVLRLQSGINMSRSIGDKDSRPFGAISDADIDIHSLSNLKALAKESPGFMGEVRKIQIMSACDGFTYIADTVSKDKSSEEHKKKQEDFLKYCLTYDTASKAVTLSESNLAQRCANLCLEYPHVKKTNDSDLNQYLEEFRDKDGRLVRSHDNISVAIQTVPLEQSYDETFATMLAVFDGHGGNVVSRMLAANIQATLIHQCQLSVEKYRAQPLSVYNRRDDYMRDNEVLSNPTVERPKDANPIVTISLASPVITSHIVVNTDISTFEDLDDAVRKIYLSIDKTPYNSDDATALIKQNMGLIQTIENLGDLLITAHKITLQKLIIDIFKPKLNDLISSKEDLEHLLNSFTSSDGTGEDEVKLQLEILETIRSGKLHQIIETSDDLDSLFQTVIQEIPISSEYKSSLISEKIEILFDKCQILSRKIKFIESILKSPEGDDCETLISECRELYGEIAKLYPKIQNAVIPTSNLQYGNFQKIQRHMQNMTFSNILDTKLPNLQQSKRIQQKIQKTFQILHNFVAEQQGTEKASEFDRIVEPFKSALLGLPVTYIEDYKKSLTAVIDDFQAAASVNKIPSKLFTLLSNALAKKIAPPSSDISFFQAKSDETHEVGKSEDNSKAP